VPKLITIYLLLTLSTLFKNTRITFYLSLVGYSPTGLCSFAGLPIRFIKGIG
jgi:hypothetical protein